MGRNREIIPQGGTIYKNIQVKEKCQCLQNSPPPKKKEYADGLLTPGCEAQDRAGSGQCPTTVAAVAEEVNQAAGEALSGK